MIECAECGIPFEGHGLRKTCSEKCRYTRSKRQGREWEKANPEKHKQIQKATREKRKDKRLEYGRKRASSRAGYIDRIFERVKLRTPDTDIDRAFLESTLTNKCSLTNVPYVFDRSRGTAFMNPYAPSLDRVDSSVGYMKNNVQWVLSAVNFAKNEMNIDMFELVWRDIMNTESGFQKKLKAPSKEGTRP